MRTNINLKFAGQLRKRIVTSLVESYGFVTTTLIVYSALVHTVFTRHPRKSIIDGVSWPQFPKPSSSQLCLYENLFLEFL